MVEAHADNSATRIATRLAFLAAGLGMACWAPLVPYAKARLGISDSGLGLYLICLGAGSIVAMPITGALVTRFGSRPAIMAGGAGLAVTLPLLAIAASGAALAPTLLLFGASLGTIDVAMNVHAVEVEQAAGTPLMSGFHGMFSLGGLIGAGGITTLLSIGLPPIGAAGAGAILTSLCIAFAAPRLLRTRPDRHEPMFAIPSGVVLVIGMLAFAAFLTEGALLDWSALLLTRSQALPIAQGGLGYAVFAIAMTAGRLSGDRIVRALGAVRVMLLGGVLVTAGFAWLLLLRPYASLGGFLLVGLGAANLVPTLFSAVGRQDAMPRSLAIAAMTTLGYAGVLAGPAVIGFVSQWFGLPGAFAMLAIIMLAFPISRRVVGAK